MSVLHGRVLRKMVSEKDRFQTRHIVLVGQVPRRGRLSASAYLWMVGAGVFPRLCLHF